MSELENSQVTPETADAPEVPAEAASSPPEPAAEALSGAANPESLPVAAEAAGTDADRSPAAAEAEEAAAAGTAPAGESSVPVIVFPVTLPFTVMSMLLPPNGTVAAKEKPFPVTFPSRRAVVPISVTIEPVKAAPACVKLNVPLIGEPGTLMVME